MAKSKSHRDFIALFASSHFPQRMSYTDIGMRLILVEEARTEEAMPRINPMEQNLKDMLGKDKLTMDSLKGSMDSLRVHMVDKTQMMVKDTEDKMQMGVKDTEDKTSTSMAKNKTMEVKINLTVVVLLKCMEVRITKYKAFIATHVNSHSIQKKKFFVTKSKFMDGKTHTKNLQELKKEDIRDI